VAATPPKPRYVFMAPWPVQAGSGVNGVILGLAQAMRDQYDAVIVTTAWQAPPPDHLWLRLPDFSLPIRNLAGFVLHFLPNLIRLRQITRAAVAVNPHFIGLELLPLLVLRKLRLCPKVILSVHGADVDAAMRTSGLRRALYNWLFTAADLVVACSRALVANVRSLSPKASVIYVWNAASPPASVSEDRPMQAPYLVCVAAFVRKKGQDVLLRAFRSIVDERPDLYLLLIGGDGPERPPLVAQIGALALSDKVKLMVNVPHHDVFWWIRHAECFILPSRDEPFGIALLEAGLMRTPVVATRVGGVPEILTEGMHGLLCESDRADQIAGAVLDTLSNPGEARRRAEAFYARACEFTWRKSFEEYRAAARLP
jgi:glycosyltransferase involved in cell wall biosynthesis